MGRCEDNKTLCSAKLWKSVPSVPNIRKDCRTSLYCAFIYKQGSIQCRIFSKIETKRQCCLLWCFICKNLDNIISRPQRTVQNNKKTKAVHDPCKHPTSFRLSQKMILTGVIELSLVRAWSRMTMSALSDSKILFRCCPLQCSPPW